ncbi:MAG: T9SS type A sorting domain-containing protein [Candidatus Electryonea clarkiae]|nr:T9SS type A sorting domain-containing protein [Candidatus Electryonea clarkiae]MDP8287286.1 T9SS type A sorting domain-containing protein [Candidatus Electryonea clarkiae]
MQKFIMSFTIICAMTTMVFAQPTEQTFTILGANGNVGDVDTYTECSLDGGVTWQDAYLTGWHPWGFATGTNSWISIDADDEVGAGGPDTLWYDFRIRFAVPNDFTNASMVFVLKADNLGDVWVNDTFITDIEGTFTYEAGDEIIDAALEPGVNEIRLHLGDYGGILGLNYRIDVTMTSAEDLSDPVYTPEEADEEEAGPYDVTIDIKPGNDNNRVNPRNRGVIPVAILTDDDFDATTVDVASLLFGPGEASPAHNGHIEDVDDDGDDDLMLHFRTQATGVTNDDTELWLTGTAGDGDIEITGSDIISIVNGRRHGNNGNGQCNGRGGGRHKAAIDNEDAIPSALSLAQNLPNPFNPTTNISFGLPEAGFASLTVYNVHGAVVEQLVNGYQPAGIQNVEFNASAMPSGTYFYVLKANGDHQVKKMLLIK